MKKIINTLVGAALAIASASAQQKTGSAAPVLVGQKWIGAAPAIARAKEFHGHVTILHFWTFGCINCRHNLPHYEKWAKTYDPNLVTVVGVHTPETPGERSEATVVRETHRLGITYPVLIDERSQNWDRYHQQFWPTVYVIDQNGQVRGKWEGELQWDGQDGESEVRKLVDQLLAETKTK